MKERFIEILKAISLKNKDMAAELGVSPNAITEVTKGRTKNIPNTWLTWLAENYNVNMNWLITGQGSRFVKNKRDENSFLENLSKLSDNELHDMENYMEFIQYKSKKLMNLQEQSIKQIDQENIYIPLLGQIAAGSPIFAEENYERKIPVPVEFIKKSHSSASIFALHVKGDSMMDSGIRDGDFAILTRDISASDLHNYAIVAALLDDEATLKYFVRRNEKIVLQPANAKYRDIELNEDLNPHLLGLLIGLIRKY